MANQCSMTECVGVVKARGMCSSHYNKWYRSTSSNYETSAQRFRRLRKEVIIFLGSECVICKFSDVRALQLDHIYGGSRGECHRRGATFLQEIVNGLRDDIQLLCANCNSIKFRKDC